MKARELTGSLPAATNPPANRQGGSKLQKECRSVARLLVVAGAFGTLAGCVNVAAPDKPIVIELNINIRQDVVYRLDADAAKTIEENKDVF